VNEEACPRCGARLPVLEGYVTWCHRCGWNLAAPHAEVPAGRAGKLYAAAGRRLGDRLATRLLAAERLEPRLTPAKVAAYAIAAGVFAFTFACALGGVLLIVLNFPHPVAIVLGLLLLALAFLTRPRFGALPDEGIVERADAPHLYGLADRVAEALETEHVDRIVVDHEFNASWAIVGLRRRRLLTLGLPLLAALGPQERVALVAHELAHARNGDSTRGLVMGSALNGLIELYGLIAPNPAGVEYFDDLGIFERIANGFLWILSRPVYGLILLQIHLLLRDSQRAEYLADALAARAAGTAATVRLHERLFLGPVVDMVVQRSARERVHEQLCGDIAEAVAAVPERERERRRRVARLEGARLDVTHPPSGSRIRLLEERPPVDAAIRLSAAGSEAIDRELAPLHPTLARRLVDEHRDRLYERRASWDY
jgi:Zn-dependent protease with chaperone function